MRYTIETDKDLVIAFKAWVENTGTVKTIHAFNDDLLKGDIRDTLGNLYGTTAAYADQFTTNPDKVIEYVPDNTVRAGGVGWQLVAMPGQDEVKARFVLGNKDFFIKASRYGVMEISSTDRISIALVDGKSILLSRVTTAAEWGEPTGA